MDQRHDSRARIRLMRVGIDVSWAARSGSGTATYTDGLVRALADRGEHHLFLYFRPGDEDVNPLYGLDSKNLTRRVVGGSRQLPRSLVKLAGRAAEDRLDLFHSPGYFLPLWGGPKVATFHDANVFLHFGRRWLDGMRLRTLSLATQTVLASAQASRILTVSHTAAADIGRVLPWTRKKLSVVHNGIDKRFFSPHPTPSCRNLRAQHGLDHYILFTGEMAPQKNVDGLIRTFACVGNRDLKLALVGGRNEPYTSSVLVPLAASLGLSDRVRFLDVVSDDALPGLYAGASAFVHLSLAEGFGLPPLEAMASGVPVIVSDLPVYHETLADAAVLVDPSRIEVVARRISDLLGDERLRSTLIRRGQTRAKAFTWETAAESVSLLYSSVAHVRR